MGTKYHKLTSYLEALDSPLWYTNFDDIESVLGFSLPASARKHQAWWSNQGKGHSLAWEDAGYRTSKLDLGSQQLLFYNTNLSERSAAENSDHPADNMRALTFAEAKAGLALHLGIDSSQIEIVIKA